MLSISWSGLGGDNLWSTAANWVGGQVPGDGEDLVFSGSTQKSTYNDLAYGFDSLTFTSSNFSISGNAVLLDGDVTINSGVVGTSIPAGIDFNDTATVNVGYGSNMTIGGLVSGDADLTLHVSSGSSMIASGGISADGELTLDLGYGSTITVGGGIADASDVTLAIPSGSHMTIDGGLSDIGGLTANEGNGSSLTIIGGISGTGDITFTEGGGSTLSVTGGIAGSGLLTLTEGDGASATIGGDVSGLSGITWNVGGGATATLSGDVSGETDLTKTGPGTLTLSGHNTFTGTTVIDTGTLRLATSDALAGSTLDYNVGDGTLDMGALTTIELGGLSGDKNLALTNGSSQAVALSVGGNGQDTTYSGVLSGLGSLTKTGSGSLTLAGSSGNTYTGGTTIAGGSLSLAKTGGYAVPDDLTFAGTTQVFVNLLEDNQITPTAQLAFTGSGSQELKLLGHDLTVAAIFDGTGLGVIENTWDETGEYDPATLTVNNTENCSFSGQLRDTWTGSGTLGLVKNGSGTLTLAAANTYTGTTSVHAGTLQIGDGGTSGTLGTGAVVIDSGAGVRFYRTDNYNNRIDVSNVFIGSGDLAFTSSGATNTGSYRLVASNPDFTGTIHVTGARLMEGANDASFGQASMIYATDGGQIYATGSTFTRPLTLGGDGFPESAGTLGALRLGSATWSGDITLVADARVTAYRSTGTLSGDITGGYALNLRSGNSPSVDTITLALGENTDYGTLKVGAGTTVVAGSEDALNTGSLAMEGGTLKLNGYSFTIDELTGTSGQIQNGHGSTESTLTVNVAGGTNTYGGTLANGDGAALALAKTGAGTLALTAANTHTGATTIAAGTLRLEASSALSGSTLDYNVGDGALDVGALTSVVLGGLSGDKDFALTNGSSQAVALSVGNNNQNTTYSGALGGLGSLTKIGSGLLTLAGATGNTYAGATIVTGGELWLGKSNGVAVPGDLYFEGTARTFVQLDGSEQIADSAHVYFNNTSDYGRFNLRGHAETVAGISTANGRGVIQNVQTESGIHANATLIVNNTEDCYYAGYLREKYSGDSTGLVSLVKQGTGTLTLSGHYIYYTGGTTVGDGTLVLRDVDQDEFETTDITNNGSLVFDNVTKNTTFSGVISGTGSLTKSGGMDLTLDGPSGNTYTGDTTLTGGELYLNKSSGPAILGNIYFEGTENSYLQISADEQVADTANLYFNNTANYGRLNLRGNTETVATINTPTGRGVIQNIQNTSGIDEEGTLVVNGSADSYFSGYLRDKGSGDSTGVVSLVKQGTGTLTLSGDHITYTGTTTIDGGTLQVGDGGTTGTLGTGAVAVNSGGTLRFYRTDNYNDRIDIANVFSGDGSMVFTSSGAMNTGSYRLMADNSGFTGTISVTGSRLMANTGNNLGSPTMIYAADGGQIFTGSGGTYDQPLTISGNGFLESAGVFGAIRLSNNVTWAGDITLAGDARIAAYNATAAITGDISGEHALEFHYSANQATNVITLTGTNTYTGGTTIASGIVNVGQGGTDGSILGDVVNNGILGFNRSDDITFSGTISGSGGLVKNGAGTLTLLADNTYAGETTINAGTLHVGDGGATGSLGGGPVAVYGSLIFDTSDTQRAFVVGSGSLTLGGSGDFILDCPGEPTVTISDPNGHLIPGGVVSVAAQTVLSGMTMTLSAVVADPWNDCEGVEFYLDTNGDGQLDGGDEFLGDGTNDGGIWSIGVSTLGWGPSAARIFAEAQFNPFTPHPPATTLQETSLNVLADWAILSPSDETGYAESGDGFSTVWSAEAVGGYYREMSGADTNAYVTYTFTDLSPGNYEIWEHYVAGHQYSSSVPIEVYDGDPATGTLQQSFNLDETWLDWSNWEVDGFDWNWSGDYFYSNTGTITVRVACNGELTQAPAIRLIAAPVAKSPNGPCSITSNDPIDYATGQIHYCGCGGDLPEGTHYDNLQAGYLGDTGYGQNDMYMPQMFGDGMYVTVITGFDDCPDTFLEPVRHYTPLYGTKATLVDVDVNQDGNGDYLLYTEADGSVHKFIYPDTEAFAIGQWFETTDPDGETTLVVSWADANGNLSSTYSSTYNKKHEVQYKTSPTAQAYRSEVYGYYGVLDPNAGLRQSITYRNWDAATNDWANDRKIEYVYYETGETELNGLTGDLKTATTLYWDTATSDWTGGDTHYFRYYTEPSSDGFAHGLKRQLLPNAYASAAEYAAGLNPPKTVEELTDEEIAPYTCFYYKYDANHRVTYEEVYGQLRTTTFEYTEGSNTKTNTNLWVRKTIEHRPDDSTFTIYTNCLGHAILTDLADTSGNHWYTYRQYDANGNVTLDAQPSAIASYAENGYEIVVTGTGSGLVNKYTYYSGTDTATATTPGSVAGYLASTGVAEGLSGTIITTAEYSYYKQTVGGQTVYHFAEQTKYTETDHTGAITTSYDDANLWYAGTVKLNQETLILPVIGQDQNGSGTADNTKQWYDEDGDLTWTRDQASRVAYFHHDSLRGRVDYMIEDVDSQEAQTAGLAPPTGWTLPNDGEHLRTDYEYDLTGRLVQVLGPEHTDSEGTLVRTASWTIYDDANHRTISATGYAWWNETEWNYTLVNPVAITITNHDGDIVEQIQAVTETTVLDTDDPRSTIAAETFLQSEYTTWSTYHYSHKQLVAVRVYYDITNEFYDETHFGYDPDGRPEWTQTPEGTITWNVLDARGLVTSTWVGTDAVPTTDYNSNSVLDVGDFRHWLSQNPTATTGPEGTSMCLVSVNVYDGGLDGGDGFLTESRVYFDSGTNDCYATQYEYDWRNRLIEVTEPDPDGQGQLASAVTGYAYDNLDRMIEETDSLGHVTAYAFDDLGRQFRVTQPDPDGEGDLQSPVTNYYYDPVGRLASLVDPVGNETSWSYDGGGRMIAEANELDDTRYFEYDDAGNLIQKTDRNGRVTQYGYDGIGRVVEEGWLDAQENVVWTISYSYDSAGRLESVGDDAAEYEYTYDDAGRVLTETQTIAGLAPVIVFTSEYNGDGSRTQLAATIGEDDDFVTDYHYDYLDRLERIEQHGVMGGNAVAEKRVDLTYTLASQFDTITRYKDLDGGSGNLVMTGTYDYDLAGRLTGLAYTDSLSATLRSFGWSYDVVSRIIGHDSDIASEDVATGDYGYDATNQLTSADYTDANRDDESFAYDENGNRTEANGQQYGDPGAANRLTTDGYYTYKYDEEGNLEYRFVDEDTSGDLTTGDTEVTEYTWDHRNRLTQVAYRPEVGEPVDWAVDYVYDALNRRIASLYDSDGGSTVDREERYVWDGNNIALDFVDPDGATGGEQSSPMALATRYLWGQAVDQLLAQEAVDDGGPEDVTWPVTDNLRSVRSLVDSTGTITSTYSYDTYGTATVLEGSLSDSRYLYTCQEYDVASGWYYYNARWYDPVTGRFVTEDPIGFDANDMNLYAYVMNSPTNTTDPSGLIVLPGDPGWPNPNGSCFPYNPYPKPWYPDPPCIPVTTTITVNCGSFYVGANHSPSPVPHTRQVTCDFGIYGTHSTSYTYWQPAWDRGGLVILTGTLTITRCVTPR